MELHMHSSVGSATAKDDSSVPIIWSTDVFWEEAANLHSIQIDVNIINLSKIFF